MWLIYALLAPFLNSIDSIGEKFLVDKHIKDEIVVILHEGFIYFLFGISMLIWHKIEILTFTQTLILLISGIFFIFYLIPYFKALIMEEASKVIPLFQFIPIFVLILSFIFLKETFSIKQFLGFIIIFISSFILSTDKLSGKIFKPSKAFWYMLLSCFIYSLAPVLFKFVVINTDFLSAFFYQAMGAGIATFILILIPKYRRNFLAEGLKIKLSIRSIMAANQLIAILAEFSSSFAITLTNVALVSVIAGTQPLFTLILAIILSLWFPHILKEDLGHSSLKSKFICILFILIGVILINI